MKCAGFEQCPHQCRDRHNQISIYNVSERATHSGTCQQWPVKCDMCSKDVIRSQYQTHIQQNAANHTVDLHGRIQQLELKLQQTQQTHQRQLDEVLVLMAQLKSQFESIPTVNVKVQM